MADEAEVKSKAPGTIVALLFIIPFGVGGFYFGIASVYATVKSWWFTSDWVATSATVITTDLELRNDMERVTVSYAYTHHGVNYEGTRVGLSCCGYDNIDTWHHDHFRTFSRAKSDGHEIQIWINPENARQSIVDREIRWKEVSFRLPFAIVFPAISIIGIWWLWHHLRTPSANTAEPDFVPENNDVIESDAKHVGSWIFAIICNGLCFPIALNIFTSESSIAPKIASAIFALIGLALLYNAIQHTRAHRYIGRSFLKLSPRQPVVGQTFHAHIAFQKTLQLEESFEVILRCELVDGRGEDTSYKKIWQQKNTVTAQLTTATTSFTVPYGLPASEPTSAEYHRWVLELAPLKKKAWLKYTFDVVILTR